jgi:three-Cys-motif partner protein
MPDVSSLSRRRAEGARRGYTKIFKRNTSAQFFEISYVDAFAGTGEIPRRELRGFFRDDPELLKSEEEFRKGSVKRALEVDPPFDHYVFIEKDGKNARNSRPWLRTFRIGISR